MENKICSPLTSASNVDVAATYRVSDIVGRWRDELGLDIASEFNDCPTDHFYLYRCRDTGIEFYKPVIEGTPALYKQLQDTFDWYYIKEKWEFDYVLQRLNEGDKVIEVGCGSGSFITKALKKGIKVVGLETSAGAVEAAKADGLPVYDCSLSEAVEILGGKPDYIVAFQVLEHIAEPLPFLAEMIRHLDKGGRLVICVPDKEGFYKYADNLLDMPPHHQTRWSESVFKNLEKILSIRLLLTSREPLSPLHVDSWISAYTHYLKKHTWYGKVVVNRFTSSLLRRALQTRLRLLFKGHTILTVFEKV